MFGKERIQSLEDKVSILETEIQWLKVSLSTRGELIDALVYLFDVRMERKEVPSEPQFKYVYTVNKIPTCNYKDSLSAE